MSSRSRLRQGFTLIELMIVVAIIGILAAIAIPKFADLIRKSQEGSTKGNVGAIRAALAVYYGQNDGFYPVDNLTSLYPNYLQNIPFSYEPPYHSKLTLLDSGTTSDDTGGWMYDNLEADSSWGVLWINCTHTDTKGGAWNTY